MNEIIKEAKKAGKAKPEKKQISRRSSMLPFTFKKRVKFIILTVIVKGISAQKDCLCP
jgi:hypothetical protein